MFPRLVSNLLSPPPRLSPTGAGVVKDCHFAWLLYLSSWCLSSPLLVALSQSMTGELFAGHMDAFCLRYTSPHLSGSWECACARNLFIQSLLPSLPPFFQCHFSVRSSVITLYNDNPLTSLSPFLPGNYYILIHARSLAHLLACSPAHSIPPSKCDLLLFLPFAVTM